MSALSAFEALALLTLGLGALLFQLGLPRVLPTEAHHRAAAARLARDARQGDLLLLQPAWSDRARLFAPSKLHVAGFAGAESEDWPEFERIWLLSQPRLPFSGPRRFMEAFAAGRERVGGPWLDGPLELTLYQNHRARRVRFDATRALARARVEVWIAAGLRTPCAPMDEGFQCPEPVGLVSSGWHEVAFTPRRCLLLKPPGGTGSLVVSFPPIESAPIAPRLVLEAGLVWDRGWKHDRGQTAVEVLLEDDASGRSLARIELPAGVEGMRAAHAPVAPGGLRLRIRSENPLERETCVRLRALSPEEGS